MLFNHRDKILISFICPKLPVDTKMLTPYTQIQITSKSAEKRSVIASPSLPVILSVAKNLIALRTGSAKQPQKGLLRHYVPRNDREDFFSSPYRLKKLAERIVGATKNDSIVASWHLISSGSRNRPISVILLPGK